MPAADHPTRSLVDSNSIVTSGARPEGAAAAFPHGSAERYALGREIARGGMGIIYRATDTVLGREIAVKVLQDKYAPLSGAALRFADEARITGQLQHPSIPPVHDVGTLPDGRPFLAMKLIKGQTLEELLKARSEPSTDRGRFLAVFEQVCQALAYAHSHDVIHRDLKPANIMVGAFGEVQVMDWGLAKVLGTATTPAHSAELYEATRAWTQISPMPDDGSHTLAGSMLGTPAFAPPEQVAGEIDKVDRRADVFGLGAILAVILTDKPPYWGETAEAVRVLALRGKLDDCFARLAACGAEPELVALCKQCLAFEPGDRSADADEVAQAVAGLRAAADERARRAELDKVRVEGERATAEAQATERRKRRRVGIGAAALLALVAVGGLGAMVVVQRRANSELASEQAKVETRNKELADEQAKVQARFDTAVKAIETFHTGVSEEALLKNEQFKELRTKLLEKAASFYAELEKLLAGQTDAKSRKTLAAGYYQLAELTDKIGDKKEALAVHRKALALRRELAVAERADIETRLDVARSLGAEGPLLADTGDLTGARLAWEEQRDIATDLEAESATDAVRAVLAQSHHGVGEVLGRTGKPVEALRAYEKALGIRQRLVDANPAVTQFQRDLARTHVSIGRVVWQTGKREEAMASYRKALAIQQKQADANPAVTEFQSDLARSHQSIGLLLMNSGRNAESLQPFQEAMSIQQKLADANPAVNVYRHDLALGHINIGQLLGFVGKQEEALVSYRKASELLQKLADANPTVAQFQRDLRSTQRCVAWVQAASRPKEALVLLAAGSAAEPEASFVWIQLAALQAWFGQEKELAATCARALGVAKDTKNPAIAERAAKTCSLRQSDAKTHEAALVLARRAVELGEGHEYLRWFQMALGMAEYRSGHYAAADAALLAAARLGENEPCLPGITAFYRSMSLFRQGKRAGARELAIAAAAQMKPLPKDEEHPLANTGDSQLLILWLAYKEAKDLIKFEAAPSPEKK